MAKLGRMARNAASLLVYVGRVRKLRSAVRAASFVAFQTWTPFLTGSLFPPVQVGFGGRGGLPARAAPKRYRVRGGVGTGLLASCIELGESDVKAGDCDGESCDCDDESREFDEAVRASHNASCDGDEASGECHDGRCAVTVRPSLRPSTRLNTALPKCW
jgi:hypothetical protein